MLDLLNEVSRTPPPGMSYKPKKVDGEPILYAFGCVLLENYAGDYFVYKAANLETKRSVFLERRRTPIEQKDVGRIVGRIRYSGIAGAAKYEVERKYGTVIGYDKCREILRKVFNDILPQYGYTVRGGQLALADEILNVISYRRTILAEADVGIGKTLAYIVAAVLAKRGRLNDFWNKGFYPHMSYVDMAQMPIVIATSSIALQKALVTEYIPEISRILLEDGVIRTPITAALRKGREHYICDRNLLAHCENESNVRVRNLMNEMQDPSAPIDFAEIDGLSEYVKRHIRVPARCGVFCPYGNICRYNRFLSEVTNPSIDIQVTNHNYLIADARLRADGKRPLLPNYQTVVVDEGHKLIAAARSMYGAELPDTIIPSMLEYIKTLAFDTDSAGQAIYATAKKLFDENRRLFRGFSENLACDTDTEDDTERYGVEIDRTASRHLRNIRDIADRLYEQLASEKIAEHQAYRKSHLLWEINQIRERAALFALPGEHITWLTQSFGGDALTLCSVPKDIDKRLFGDLWSKGIPTVITSGTLSAGGGFSHIRRSLGLDGLGDKLRETSKPSPFNHKDNALIYISEDTAFPDSGDPEYIASITDEIERLIAASHGHAAVLFTSYDVMGRVHAALDKRNLPFPLVRLERGSSAAIEKFKRTRGAVLFASGALWEGIDIPGDALSMLIIVKLPFQVPDPISDYEQSLYQSLFEYKRSVVVPEMLIKLRQGFGRLIRTETDTGVVAILDKRASASGAYRDLILSALPDCRVTDSIRDVEDFIYEVKPEEYFVCSA